MNATLQDKFQQIHQIYAPTKYNVTLYFVDLSSKQDKSVEACVLWLLNHKDNC